MPKGHDTSHDPRRVPPSRVEYEAAQAAHRQAAAQAREADRLQEEGWRLAHQEKYPDTLEYAPERDDFPDYTDTPEDYEGDRYIGGVR